MFRAVAGTEAGNFGGDELRELRRAWAERERHLVLDRAAAWREVEELTGRAEAAEAERDRLAQELAVLRRRVAELESAHRAASAEGASILPSFVKPNVGSKRRKPPGRKAGHAAAVRALPPKIDREQAVPLSRDERGRELCPCCATPLVDLKDHARLVEDVRPPELEVTRYRTRSGHCVKCDRRVESRAARQPPAHDLPHGQIGLNAMAMCLMLRIRQKLPYRQIATVMHRLAGLSVSAGGLVKQLRRIAGWLSAEYEQLLLRLRAAKVIHADETGWRIDGKNAWAWVFTEPLLTLFVIDRSRGGQVVKETLGEAFGGTLVCDFYGAYNAMEGPKQRCLTHLLRELKEQAEKDASFAQDGWVKSLKAWCQRSIDHKKKWDTLNDPAYERGASRLEDRLDGLIRGSPAHDQAKRLHARVKRHRSELTRFLWDKSVEPTNNAAERALRPLVVTRKITGGSRGESTAQAWAKLSSLLATQEQTGQNVLTATKKLLTDYWAREGR